MKNAILSFFLALFVLYANAEDFAFDTFAKIEINNQHERMPIILKVIGQEEFGSAICNFRVQVNSGKHASFYLPMNCELLSLSRSGYEEVTRIESPIRIVYNPEGRYRIDLLSSSSGSLVYKLSSDELSSPGGGESAVVTIRGIGCAIGEELPEIIAVRIKNTGRNSVTRHFENKHSDVPIEFEVDVSGNDPDSQAFLAINSTTAYVDRNGYMDMYFDNSIYASVSDVSDNLNMERTLVNREVEKTLKDVNYDFDGIDLRVDGYLELDNTNLTGINRLTVGRYGYLFGNGKVEAKIVAIEGLCEVFQDWEVDHLFVVLDGTLKLGSFQHPSSGYDVIDAQTTYISGALLIYGYRNVLISENVVIDEAGIFGNFYTMYGDSPIEGWHSYNKLENRGVFMSDQSVWEGFNTIIVGNSNMFLSGGRFTGERVKVARIVDEREYWIQGRKSGYAVAGVIGAYTQISLIDPVFGDEIGSTRSDGNGIFLIETPTDGTYRLTASNVIFDTNDENVPIFTSYAGNLDKIGIQLYRNRLLLLYRNLDNRYDYLW